MSINIGYALTGSFCTFEKSIKQMENLVNDGYNIIPILSFNASSISTRFGEREYFIDKIQEITGNEIIDSIEKAEPIGPKNLIDLLVISPCSGNTIAKIANSIYDTPVTLALKSHIRNERPVLIGVSTNDALSLSAQNIGKLLNYKHFYFIPMGQDNYEKKPFSMVAKFEKTKEAILCALNSKQLQPIIE